MEEERQLLIDGYIKINFNNKSLDDVILELQSIRDSRPNNKLVFEDLSECDATITIRYDRWETDEEYSERLREEKI